MGYGLLTKLGSMRSSGGGGGGGGIVGTTTLTFAALIFVRKFYKQKIGKIQTRILYLDSSIPSLPLPLPRIFYQEITQIVFSKTPASQPPPSSRTPNPAILYYSNFVVEEEDEGSVRRVFPSSSLFGGERLRLIPTLGLRRWLNKVMHRCDGLESFSKALESIMSHRYWVQRKRDCA